MFEEIKYVPHCARRYSVDQYGNICQGKNIIPQIWINNTLTVELDWVDGRKHYEVALIILICFGKLRLPDHLYSRVEPLYIDGNRKNVSPGNLLYRYRQEMIEVEGFPGHYHIPFYNDYAINRSGTLINIHTGKVKSWSLTPQGGPKNQTGGYRYTRVVNDEGYSKILFLHRALCLVFKKYDASVYIMVVNHLDGDPGNNVLENLEWTTYRENNIHAVSICKRPNSSDPILMLDLKTGKETKFPSIMACVRYLGHKRDTFIYRRLRHNPPKVFEDMLVFKYDNGQPWPVIDKDKVEESVWVGSDIIARNVFTGKCIIFTGCIEGAKLTGVKAATILSHVKEMTLIPICGYNFRYLDSEFEWPGHTARHLQIYEKYPIYPPDGVVMVNVETGQEVFYTSVSEAANECGFSKRLMRNKLFQKSLHKDKYMFNYFKLREELGPAIAKSMV